MWQIMKTLQLKMFSDGRDGLMKFFSSSSRRSSRLSGNFPAKNASNLQNKLELDPPIDSLDDLLEGKKEEKHTLTYGWSKRWKPHEAVSSSEDQPSVGFEVPYRFRVVDVRDDTSLRTRRKTNRSSSEKLMYTDFSGMRFPTLQTAENFRYWKTEGTLYLSSQEKLHIIVQDTGFDRFKPRVFPIKLPTHSSFADYLHFAYRQLDPTLREYIYFQNSLDPNRFSVLKVAERYGLQVSTVKKVIQEYRDSKFLTELKVGHKKSWRITRSEAVMQMKELIYSKRIGYKQIGDEDAQKDKQTEFQGYKSTFDWLERQAIQVEAMSAFPMMEKREPFPKKVDVDVTVFSDNKRKIMNWIDPTDLVAF